MPQQLCSSPYLAWAFQKPRPCYSLTNYFHIHITLSQLHRDTDGAVVELHRRSLRVPETLYFLVFLLLFISWVTLHYFRPWFLSRAFRFFLFSLETLSTKNGNKKGKSVVSVQKIRKNQGENPNRDEHAPRLVPVELLNVPLEHIF